MAVVGRVSRNRGVERIDGRFTVIPLHIVTNMRDSVSRMLRDYPGWKFPLAGYVETFWKIVDLRDTCQRVAGWVRNQNPIERGMDRVAEVVAAGRPPLSKMLIRR